MIFFKNKNGDLLEIDISDNPMLYIQVKNDLSWEQITEEKYTELSIKIIGEEIKNK